MDSNKEGKVKFTQLLKQFIFNRKEVTFKSIIFGLIFGALLASSNVYLAMKVGAFNGGSIPGAILGSGMLHLFGSQNIIFETNIIQTITSAGANFSGAYFDAIPVAASFDFIPGYFQMFLYLAFGGLIGISLTVLFRRYLVVEEKLSFPNGIAVANSLEVISSGKAAFRKMKILAIGFVLSAILVTFQSQLLGGIIPGGFDLTGTLPDGFMTGIAISPLLLGFGYMMGLKSAAGYFIGNLLTGVVLSPIFLNRGLVSETAWAPVAKIVASPASGLLIGGTVFAMLMNYKSFIRAFSALTKINIKTKNDSDQQNLWDMDLPLYVPLSIILIGTVVLSFTFKSYANVIFFPLIIVCAFLFALVAARTTGETGICPTSLFVWISMALIGGVITKNPGIIAFLSGIIAVAVGQASDSMNDLKTGYLIKATPASQQLVQYIGLLGGAIFAPLAFVTIVKAYGIFNEQFPVPFGMVAREIVISISEGVNPFNGLTLSFGLVGGALLTFFNLPALPIGLGMFAPLTFGATVFIGGLIRKFMSKKGPDIEDDGISFFSGVLAGEGLMGVLIAAIVAFVL